MGQRALGEVQRWRVLRWRPALLIGLLAAAVGALVFKWNDLALAYRLNAAQRALAGGDWSSAAAILERSNERGERSAQWHYLQARAQRRAGEHERAQRHLTRAAALGWDPAEIDRQRLLLRAQSGQIKQVEPRLAAVLQTDLSDEEGEEIYEAMARGYLASLHVQDASRCLKFWMDWQPDNPLPRLWMGDLYRRIENPAAAAEEYRKVLALRPEHSEARVKLAQVYLERSQVAEAAELFEASAERPETAAKSLLGLAECRRRQGQAAAARSLLYDALVLELAPDQAAEALVLLGRLAIEERDFAAAIDLLQRSLALNPIEPAGRVALASALAAIGQSDLAEAERAAARRLVEENTRLQSLTRQAIANPGDAQIRCEAGLILLRHGLLSPGRDWLLAAIEIDPAHRAAHAGLAGYYERIGDQAQAERHRSLSGPAAGSPAGDKMSE
jgi:Tfp pilus assembly protein PilF